MLVRKLIARMSNGGESNSLAREIPEIHENTASCLLFRVFRDFRGEVFSALFGQELFNHRTHRKVRGTAFSLFPVSTFHL